MLNATEQEWRVQFVDIDSNGQRSNIGSYIALASNIDGAKRKAHKLAQANPDMAEIVANGRARWNALTNYSEVKHYGSTHSVAGSYIYVSAIKHRQSLWIMLMLGLATLITFATIVWFSLSQPLVSDRLANALRSVDANYGRRVIQACNNRGQVDFRKLQPIVKDYNKSVGVDRDYIINDDYADMIEQLTDGRYTLRYTYIVSTR